MRRAITSSSTVSSPAAASSLAASFGQWLRAQGYASRTVESRVYWAGRYLSWLVRKGGSVSSSTMNAWLSSLEDRGLSCSTLNAAHAVAIEVENLAVEYLAMLAAGLEPVLLSDAELQRVIDKFADYGRLARS